jgi:hypothetical protein
MRNFRTLAVALVLIILAGLFAWMVLKPGVVAEPSTPSAQRSAETSAPFEPARESGAHTPANASMTNAPQHVAAQLDLRTIRTCHDALLNKKSLEYMDPTPQEVNEAEAAAASCPADLLMASAYYEAIKELALRGDIAAQRCFIQGYFASAAQEGEESHMRKDQVDEYLGLTRRFIDEALARGDWSVVRYLARSRIGLQDSMLRTAYPFGFEHLETGYRMNYLLMLGNQHNFETSVDPRQFVEDTRKFRSLTSEQIQQAEGWAKILFDQHFNGSQEGASIAQFCEH